MEYQNFEAALENLKKVVGEFENADNMSIEDLLKNYEEGMEAYSFCMKKLEDTQKKIKIIESNFE